MSGAIPVLWLCGPSGVGKTTVAWEIYSRLTQSGVDAAYVDIDQLGMCHPEPASDPGRHRLQAENLGAVVAGYQAAGARCVVVSGVVDPAHGVYVDKIPQAVLTVCRLRVERAELERRLVGRQGAAELVPEALREADAMGASDFTDVCIDTTGLSADEVAGLVRDRIGDWPALDHLDPSTEVAQPHGGTAATAADGQILWLCGVTGVGKSTIGFEVYLKTLRSGLAGAYVDLDQIGFCSPAPPDDPRNHRLKARILPALWRTFRAAGAQCLTVVGPAEDQTAVERYIEALPAATVTVCRLHAGRDELTRRIRSRGQGGSWSQPGDPLNGRPAAYLLDVADQAATEAEALERSGLGDLRVGTDGQTAQEVAEAILAHVGPIVGRVARP